MRSQKSGVIVNVTSIGGLDARPACSLYSGSKFALEGPSTILPPQLITFGSGG